MSKPTRRDLIATIAKLQHIIGQAESAYFNDRGERAELLTPLFKKALNLCYDTTRHFPAKWMEAKEPPDEGM